jgi:hypothetical protein
MVSIWQPAGWACDQPDHLHAQADPASQSDAKALVIEFVSRDAYTDYVLIDGSYTGFYVSHRDTFTSGQVGQEGLLVAVSQMQYAIDHAEAGLFDNSKGYPAIS